MKRFSLHVLTVMLAVMGIVVVSGGCRQATEKPKGPSEKITIAYSTLPHTSLFHIALVKGFFLSEGLEVSPQPHEFGKLALEAVLTGKADLATPADTPIMFAVAGGRKIYAIAVIAASHRSSAIIARRDLGIEKPEDLKGKRIGVPLGTTGAFFLDSFLSVRGINRKEVRVIDMKPGEMSDAIIKGTVDAVVAWHPNLLRIQGRLEDKGLVFYDETLYGDILCLAGSQEFVKQHPEAIKKVLRALIKAESFIKQNPDESRRLVAEFLKIDRVLLDQMMDSFDFKVVLDQTLLVSLEDQTRWAQQYGLTGSTNMPNYLEFIYTTGLQTVKPEAVRIIR